MGVTTSRIWTGAIAMSSTLALIVGACGQGGGGGAADGGRGATADPAGWRGGDAPPLAGEPRAARPLAPTGGLVERVAVATTDSKIAAAPARPAVTLPPAPSADLYALSRGRGEASPAGAAGAGPRGGFFGLGRGAAEESAAPVASAPPSPMPPPPSPAPAAPMAEAFGGGGLASGAADAPAARSASPARTVYPGAPPPAYPGAPPPAYPGAPPPAMPSIAASEAEAPAGGAPPGPMAYPQMQPQRRVLTAGAVADVDHREDYLGFLSRYGAEAQTLRLDMGRRVRFLVVDALRRPVHDAYVTVVGNGDRPFTGRTHSDGIWDFHPGVSAPQISGQVTVQVQHGQSLANVVVEIPPYGDGLNYLIQLPDSGADLPRRLDLAYLIDVTGSMGDELAYVNEEITGIVERVRAAVPQIDVRVAATFYRDRRDDVLVEQIPFDADVAAFTDRMRHVRASGGGDYPEDLDTGLAAAMNTLSWTRDGAARVLVVIADAPPQRYADQQYTYHTALEDAARRGIRVLPVAASGANREVEFLFRAMGAFTSTPYVYLTDDSGIGSAHMEADSAHVSREMFADLLTRLLIADLQGEGMH